MAKLTFFAPFSMPTNIDFVASFSDFFVVEPGTAPGSQFFQFVSFTIENEAAQRAVGVTGDFQIDFVNERGGTVKGLSGGATVEVDDDEEGVFFVQEYLATDLDTKVKDFDDARLTGDPFKVWEELLDDDDLVRGSFGPDDLAAFDGDDVMRGNGGDDTLRGMSGDDTINGSGGGDRLFGGAGDDRIQGQGGDDRLNGAGGLDTLKGGGGDDRLVAGGGADSVVGGAGDDNARGGGANDRIAGGGGADRLRGDAGNDTLIGGAGADVLIFNTASGDDLVVNFQQGVDLLDVQGVGAFAALGIAVRGGDTIISFGRTTITLDDFDAGLTADDFLF